MTTRVTTTAQAVLLAAASIANPTSAQDYASEVAAVRSYYLQSAVDAANVDSAVAIIAGLPLDAESDPLVQAFSGALVVMKAKHAFWPGRKLAYVKRGLRTLDDAVDRDPRHAEIRYLRLISCYYLPGFFGRSDSVDEDFRVLSQTVENLRPVVSSEFYADLVEFVIDKGKLDAETNASLRSALSDAVDVPEAGRAR